MSLIDSHCHLADEAFAEDLPAVVDRARAAGLAGALCILSADDADEIARASSVRQAWAAVAFAAAVHPHRAAPYAGGPSQAAQAVEDAIYRVSAVAVGEIGLDYHYDYAPRDVQQHVFAAQVASAGANEMPVIIHTREASEDTLAILKDARPAVRGVMHCFTGTREEARQALDLGFYVSFSGIITFPRSADLREVAAFVPSDRLLVETDAPYLAPVPHRGRRNEPGWVAETMTVLASTRGVDRSSLEDTVAVNFADLFRVTFPRVDTPPKPMV